MEPLTIVVSFDVGEQLVPGGIPGWVRPGGGFCRFMAMVRAAMVNSARMWSRIAQPTILRVKRSSTTAR